MSVSSVIGLVSFKKLTGNDDDDWVDRLNHLYTVVLLIIFAVFVGSGQYVGDPIQCWTPAQFTGAFNAYTKSYCWIKNTYYVPMHDTIPVNHAERDNREITYYQWIPIILVFMAFMFKFPCLCWRMLNGYSGINLDKLVNLTTSTQLGDPKKRDETVKHIAVYIDRWLETHRQYHSNIIVRVRAKVSRVCCFLCSRRDGTFLVGLYVFIKILYVVNVICQFFLLNGFMGDFYSLFGLEVIDHLARGWEVRESARFPRITLCDFDIRQLQNVQRFTVQCVLPINLFNEKIFIFLWFWFVFVAALTCGNFLFWVYRILFRRNRLQYVKKYLKIVEEFHGESDRAMCQKMADDYLRDDGIFVLRLVAKNANAILLSDLVKNIWHIWKDKPMNKKSITDDMDDSHA